MKKSCIDVNELEKFRNELEKFNETQSELMQACTNELTKAFLSKVIRATPVGTYPSKSGKQGGTLRKGWTYERKSPKETEIINPVEYASYVEYGHRTRNDGWVDGQFMMKKTENLIQRNVPKIIGPIIKEKLGDVFKC